MKLRNKKKTNTLNLNRKECEAKIADKETKKILWKQYITNNTNESMMIMLSSMEGFMINLEENLEEAEIYENLFFEDLFGVFKTQDKEYAKNFYDALFPRSDQLRVYDEKITKLIQNIPQNEASLLKQLRESNENLKRRMKAYESLNQGLPKVSDEDVVDALIEDMGLM